MPLQRVLDPLEAAVPLAGVPGARGALRVLRVLRRGLPLPRAAALASLPPLAVLQGALRQCGTAVLGAREAEDERELLPPPRVSRAPQALQNQCLAPTQQDRPREPEEACAALAAQGGRPGVPRARRHPASSTSCLLRHLAHAPSVLHR